MRKRRKAVIGFSPSITVIRGNEDAAVGCGNDSAAAYCKRKDGISIHAGIGFSPRLAAICRNEGALIRSGKDGAVACCKGSYG